MLNDLPSENSISILKLVIHDAFERVRLEGGVGLWEGQALDNYATAVERAKARKRDEKMNWWVIPEEDLIRCSSSLSFFAAEGMRFHLPAYMMLDIDGKDTTGSLIFHLTTNASKQFSALNHAQREAVDYFLRWCSHRLDYEDERDSIKNARERYWSISL